MRGRWIGLSPQRKRELEIRKSQEGCDSCSSRRARSSICDHLRRRPSESSCWSRKRQNRRPGRESRRDIFLAPELTGLRHVGSCAVSRYARAIGGQDSQRERRSDREPTARAAAAEELEPSVKDTQSSAMRAREPSEARERSEEDHERTRQSARTDSASGAARQELEPSVKDRGPSAMRAGVQNAQRSRQPRAPSARGGPETRKTTRRNRLRTGATALTCHPPALRALGGLQARHGAVARSSRLTLRRPQGQSVLIQSSRGPASGSPR